MVRPVRYRFGVAPATTSTGRGSRRAATMGEALRAVGRAPGRWRSAHGRCRRLLVSVPRSIFASGLFAGQVALITGGGSGIGLAAARELAYLGAQIAILGRKPEKIQAAVATLEADGIAPLHLFGST